MITHFQCYYRLTLKVLHLFLIQLLKGRRIVYNKGEEKMKMQYKKDDIVEGIITNIVPYGGFVYIDHETTGLIHISQLHHGFVSDIHRFLNIGQRVYCKVMEVDQEKGQLKLSLKNLPKNAKPRIQRRERANLKAHTLLPQSKIGFSSLASQLPKWIKEKTEHD